MGMPVLIKYKDYHRPARYMDHGHVNRGINEGKALVPVNLPPRVKAVFVEKMGAEATDKIIHGQCIDKEFFLEKLSEFGLGQLADVVELHKTLDRLFEVILN